MPPQEIARIIQQQGSLPALLGDIMRRKAIDAIVAGAEVDGGPGDEALSEVSLTRIDGVITEAPPEVVDVPTEDAPAPEGGPAPADDAGSADISEEE